MAANFKDFPIGDYLVNLKEVIGFGGYGIVYKAKDHSGNATAVKRIQVPNVKRKRRISENFNAILQLDHPHILRFFGTFWNESKLNESLCWLFMEFCLHGNLGNFISRTNLSPRHLLEAMIQMAQGVEYLHRNNIVHRDFKPTNILVASASPFVLKLTDFDMCRVLGEDFKTSKMSSNVGCAAFKAPELFVRNKEGKLVYHRSVDIYSLGLTYLAILQGNRMLLPKLETAVDVFEAHLQVPIGSIMAIRSKDDKNKEPLTVIYPENDCAASVWPKWDSTSYEPDLRKLILQMTHLEPKQRATAGEVLQTIRSLTDVGYFSAYHFNCEFACKLSFFFL